MELKGFDPISRIRVFVRSFIGSFLKSFIIGFIVLAINGAIIAYYGIKVRYLKEFESPYKIADDTVKIIILSQTRGRLLDSVFANENFLLRFIKSIEIKSYGRIKSAIPKDDLLLDYIEFRMEKVPYINCAMPDEEFDRSLIRLLERIRNKTSVVKGMNEKVKFKLIHDNVGFIINGIYGRDNSTLDFIENYVLDLMNNDQMKDQENKHYRDFIMITTLYEIDKQRLSNSVDQFNSNTCYNPLYLKLKDRILEANSYMVGRVKNNTRDFTSDLMDYVEKEISTLDWFEKQYCKMPADTEGNLRKYDSLLS
jgi:hypothetical protein